MLNKTLVMIPTYNEVDNVSYIVGEISKLNLPIDILFIDDNSPDGTGTKLDKIKSDCEGHQNIIVIHRSGKLGIGSAHKLGIQYAHANGYTKLITMDCDGTHDPKSIPEFISKSDHLDYDIIVGSRHITEGSLVGWSLWRRFVTQMGHLLTTVVLGIPYDATGAFRLYRFDKFPIWYLLKAKRDDYAFFFESLTICHKNGVTILEIPIKLAARSAGNSKLKPIDLIKSLIFMIKLRYYIWFDKHKVIV